MSERQMTSIADKIKQTRNQQQATLVIADALDLVLGQQRLLIERLDRLQPSEEEWSDWTAESLTSVDLHSEVPSPLGVVWSDALLPLDHQARVAQKQEIESLREQLAATHDPEDFRALEARLRLARDAAGERAYDGVGAALPPSVPDGQRTGITSDGATGEVDIPPPTQERFNDRYSWAQEHNLHEFLPQFTSVDAATSFAMGGARWLYYGNRDAVLAMPADWRQWLVRDIAVESEAEAQEVSRDIFKSAEGIARPSA